MNEKDNVVSFVKNKHSYLVLVDNNVCGICLFCFPIYDDKTIFIANLEIFRIYRGYGYGTLLLYELLMDAYNNCMEKVSLNDVSSKCHQQNNIYIKMGLFYNNGTSDNSMIGNLRHILYGKKNYRIHHQERFSY
jgi:hypothetical protein